MKKTKNKRNDKINLDSLLKKVDRKCKKNNKMIDVMKIEKLHLKLLKFLMNQNKEFIDKLNMEISNKEIDNNKRMIIENIFNNFGNDNKNEKVSNKIKSKKPNFKGEHKCFTDYKVIRELGSGAFGTTFLTEKGGKQYAIKQIEIRLNPWSDKLNVQIDNIKKEINISIKMGENKIGPKIYDDYMCKTMGKLSVYIVMDYMNLGTLKDWLQNNQLSKKNKEQIKNKINMMHKNSVHQDLHLENILVNKKDNKINFYLSDFGLSHTFQSLIDNTKNNDLKRFEDSLKWEIKRKYNNLISSLFVY